jgi:hypothetical protein
VFSRPPLDRVRSFGIYHVGQAARRIERSVVQPAMTGPAFSHGLRRRPVDPGGGGFGEGHEVLGEHTFKLELPGRVNSVHAAEMHLIRGHQADHGMGQTGRRRQSHHGVRQGASSLDVSGMPSKAATFFECR